MEHLLGKRIVQAMASNAYQQTIIFIILYADDVLLFGKATIKNVKAFNDIFKLYGSLSGHMVNWHKSDIFYGMSISPHCILKIQQVMNMKKEILPFVYLGVPLFVGVPKKCG